MRETTKEPMDVFISKIEEARSALSEIEEALDDHLGFAPEEINWGHVGDARWITERLGEIMTSTTRRRVNMIFSSPLDSV